MAFNELLIPLLVFRSVFERSQKTQNQYFAFLGPFCSFLGNIVVIFTMSAKFSTFWSCQTSISTKSQKITFFCPIVPLFIDTKTCMQIYISIPNVLRRPKYKLSKRY